MRIKIEPYNIDWKNQFKIEREILADLLKDYHPKIEHIGSTTIENCVAKPIIDILIGLESEDDFENVIAVLTQYQYVYFKLYNELMPYRRFFVKYEYQIPLKIFNYNEERNLYLNEKHLIQLHVTTYKNDFWKRHIAFRNYLQTHDIDRHRYSNLKIELSKQNWKDGNEYNEAKNSLVKEIEQKALIEYRILELRNEM